MYFMLIFLHVHVYSYCSFLLSSGWRSIAWGSNAQIYWSTKVRIKLMQYKIHEQMLYTCFIELLLLFSKWEFYLCFICVSGCWNSWFFMSGPYSYCPPPYSWPGGRSRTSASKSATLSKPVSIGSTNTTPTPSNFRSSLLCSLHN